MKINRPVVVCDVCKKEIIESMEWFTVVRHARKDFMNCVNDNVELDICSEECMKNLPKVERSQFIYAMSASYAVSSFATSPLSASYVNASYWDNPGINEKL